MKLSIVLAGFTTSIVFSTCQTEYISADQIGCTVEYNNHTKNSEYQGIVTRYTGVGLPGLSVLIDTPEDGLWEGAAGFANIEDQIPMTPCHIHYAASIPKSFTAIAILQQIEAGRISLDSKISDYLEEEVLECLPNPDKITVNNLLNHTSGLPDVIDIEFITRFFNEPDYYYQSLTELMELIKDKKAVSEPGTDFLYTDTNFILLALILDGLTGDHLVTFREDIFDPLGLANTCYSYTINHSAVNNLVSGYIDTYSDGSVENVTAWEDAITSYVKGSGGMTTNCYDLSLFVQGVFNGSLVSEEHIDRILSDTVHNPLADEWMNDSYSLGFMVIHDEHGTWYGHAGRDPGAASYIFHNIEHNITIAAMTNIGTFFSMHYTKIFYNDLWIDLCNAAINGTQ